MIKKILKVLFVIVILITVFLFWALKNVDNTPYLQSDYYSSTKVRLDSIVSDLGISGGRVRIGLSKNSITPVLLGDMDDPSAGKFVVVPLSGYGGRKGAPATGIHDSLFVKAIAIEVNEKIMVFVGSDLLIMPPDVSNLSDKTVAEKTGLTRENIFYSATHTHSGPGAWSGGAVGEMFAGEFNPNVVAWLSRQVSKTIIEAVENLKPGKIGIGNFRAREFVKNRLVGDEGTVNDDFLMIVAEQPGEKKVIMGSYDAHATTLGDSNMEISADYPGYWQRKLEANGFDMAVFFAGSVGSHGYRSKGEGFEKPKYMGEALADSTIKYAQKITTKDSTVAASLTLKIDYPEFQIRVSDGLRLNPVIARRLFPEVGDVFLQTIRLDSLIWTTTPCDFSGETAITIKNAMHIKGFRAMVTSFNGAYTGYVIPCKYYHLNEYESRMMNWFGPGYNPFINHMVGELTEKVSSSQ